MYPAPTTKKDVRSFLGLTGNHRRFIPNYTTTAKPLTDLTQKKCTRKNSMECDVSRSFSDIETDITKQSNCQEPDFSKVFILQVDASEAGIGAVLSQLDDNDQDHPIGYFSRKLLPRKQKYATVEKGCLAVKLGIQHFAVYLMGKPFRI